jgi:hypothetical protein
MNELRAHLRAAITMLEDRLGIVHSVDINLHLLAVLDGIDQIERLFGTITAALPPHEIATEHDKAA